MDISFISFVSSVIAIVFAVSIHEFCHAWVADRLGDPTARFLGRISLNPLRHFDLFGTLALIFIGIGWGKPVPINPNNLRHPKRDGALIALAGPLSNLLTAILLAWPLKYLAGTSFQALPVYDLIVQLFLISIILFSLNILPFPPFDGSKILGIFVPRSLEHWYDRYLNDGQKYVIIFILFDIFFLRKVVGFSFLNIAIQKVTSVVLAVIALGT